VPGPQVGCGVTDGVTVGAVPGVVGLPGRLGDVGLVVGLAECVVFGVCVGVGAGIMLGLSRFQAVPLN
jgi:hypothetical protein